MKNRRKYIVIKNIYLKRMENNVFKFRNLHFKTGFDRMEHIHVIYITNMYR